MCYRGCIFFTEPQTTMLCFTQRHHITQINSTTASVIRKVPNWTTQVCDDYNKDLKLLETIFLICYYSLERTWVFSMYEKDNKISANDEEECIWNMTNKKKRECITDESSDNLSIKVSS